MASFASFQAEIENDQRALRGKNPNVQGTAAQLGKIALLGGKPAATEVHREDIRDEDGRTLLERLLHPTAESISSLASLLNQQIGYSTQSELLLALSAHNLNETSLVALLDVPDRSPAAGKDGAAAAAAQLPLLVTQENIDTAVKTLRDAAQEVQLYASVLWSPLDPKGGEEAEALAKYAPQTSANDDETTQLWDAKDTLYVLIRARPHTAEELLELRVAVVGNVDAGKSTLLGVLTKGRLDDGRGKARVALFRHKHEIETGRTSSVGMEIMGFGPNGREVTAEMQQAAAKADPNHKKKDLSWDEICKEAAKVIGFIDLAGHERYFKTTIGALSSCSPDFVLLIVGANAGIVGMSKEHLSVSLALNVPVVVIITKIDSTPANVLDTTVKQLAKILRSPGCRKSPVFVKNRGMACSLAKSFVQRKAAPIFLVSNVTGDGLEPLKCFLNALTPTSQDKFDSTAPLELSISDVFSVPFVGCVVSGVILAGTVKAGDPVLIGPDSLGAFIPTSIRSIERKRVRVGGGEAGQSVALALKRIRRNQVRKGMVLLAPDAQPKAILRFTASVLILYHNSTIAKGYQAMAHIGSVRQTVRIVDIDKPFVRTGDRCSVVFEFIKTPEFVRPGSRILFREGKTKGLGVITSLTGDVSKAKVAQ